MKIYTKKGDAGQTGLFGGARVSKSDQRVVAYGKVDAANSALGFSISCRGFPSELVPWAHSIMSDLFDLGAELSCAEKKSAHEMLEKKLDNAVDEARVIELESMIDRATDALSPLKCFILPTGVPAAGALHVARTAVRQAEQEIVKLIEDGVYVRPVLLKYINRLSDLIFIWARFSNHKSGLEDIVWKPIKDR